MPSPPPFGPTTSANLAPVCACRLSTMETAATTAPSPDGDVEEVEGVTEVAGEVAAMMDMGESSSGWNRSNGTALRDVSRQRLGRCGLRDVALDFFLDEAKLFANAALHHFDGGVAFRAAQRLEAGGSRHAGFGQCPRAALERSARLLNDSLRVQMAEVFLRVHGASNGAVDFV
jgi:hypothetical protein